MHIILSVLSSAVTTALFFLLLRRTDRNSLPKGTGRYTVLVPIGGRIAFFSVSMFGLFMTVQFFRQVTTETLILGCVSAFIFVVMLVRTLIHCMWKIEVWGSSLTLYRLFRKPCQFCFDDITLVSRNSRGYSIYAGTKELFNFVLGKEKTNPGAYLLQKELEERSKWAH